MKLTDVINDPGDAGAGGDPAEAEALALPVTDADHALGPADAPVTVVEYGDYECPYCHDAEPAVEELLRRCGDRLRLVFRHFPQNSVHPHAAAAAMAAEAAAAQGKFWEMHRALFRHQKDLAEVDLVHLALGAGVEVYRFQSDLENPSLARHVRNDVAGGLRSGVRGTPAFFINGLRHRGPTDYDSLRAAVGPALDGPGGAYNGGDAGGSRDE